MASSPHSKSASSGWWRLLAVISFVCCVTLGLAFYMPLRESQQLLSDELTLVKNKSVALEQSLAQTEASLKQVTAERTELQGFKADVATEEQRYPKIAEQFADAEAPLDSALEKKQIQASALVDGLSVAWTNPALLNWKKTQPSRTGFKLLCPTVSEAKALELPRVTVRTFTASDTAPPDAEQAYTTATELAITLADRIVRYCSVPPDAISVASSPAKPSDDKSKDTRLVQFEFRGGKPSTDVGL